MNDKVEGKGRAVLLPNGQKRVDFIRDSYYDKKTGKHTDGCKSRSEIKNEINEMLPEDQAIPYQIVFAATKAEEDPRIAAAARAEERARVKAEKEAAAKAEKEKAAKAKK